MTKKELKYLIKECLKESIDNKKYFHPLRNDMKIFIFKAKNGIYHDVYECPPDKWAEEHGATHTLYIGPKDFAGGGTRPAKLLKTVLYIGVDEDENSGIKWEKIEGIVRSSAENSTPYPPPSREQIAKWSGKLLHYSDGKIQNLDSILGDK